MTSVNRSLSLPFPSAQLRRSWSTWTRTGPCYAGTASACRTWTVTKSPVGSPAAAWQESWSSPAHRRSERGSPPPDTHIQRHRLSCSMRGSSEDPGWKKAGGETVMGLSRRKEDKGLAISQRHCVLRWRGGTERRWLTWEKGEQLQETDVEVSRREQPEEMPVRHRDCIPVKGRLL